MSKAAYRSMERITDVESARAEYRRLQQQADAEPEDLLVLRRYIIARFGPHAVPTDLVPGGKYA